MPDSAKGIMGPVDKTETNMTLGSVFVTEKRMLFVAWKKGFISKEPPLPVYFGFKSCLKCPCNPFVICSPVDEYERPHPPDHEGRNGTFLDAYVMPPRTCGQCCGSICYPYGPCIPSVYTLTSKLSDELTFLPLPLNKVRQMKVDAYTSVLNQAIIYSPDGCCSCANWFPNSNPRQWATIPAAPYTDLRGMKWPESRKNDYGDRRVITMDAMLPPWNKRSTIKIRVNRETDMVSLLKFTSAIQTASPLLINGTPDIQEGGRGIVASVP